MAKTPRFPGVLRSTAAATEIKAALPVRGAGQWQAMADAQVWLAGRGAQLVSVNPSGNGPSSGGGTMGLSFYAYPHKQILNWLWIVSMAKTSGTASIFGEFQGAQGTTLGEWQLDTNAELYSPQHFLFVETFTAMTMPYTFGCTFINNSSSASVDVVGVQAVELPMFSITTFGSAATPLVEPSTCATNAPIYEPGSGRKSANGLTRVAADTAAGTGMIREARRAFLLGWCNAAGVTITDTTYPGTSQFFSTPPSVVARHLYVGVTTATVKVALLALASGAPNTASVKLTAATGGTCSIDVTSGSLAWYTGDLVVETEDLSRNATDGGLRGGSRETLTVVGKVAGGTTHLFVYSLFVMEAE